MIFNAVNVTAQRWLLSDTAFEYGSRHGSLSVLGRLVLPTVPGGMNATLVLFVLPGAARNPQRSGRVIGSHVRRAKNLPFVRYNGGSCLVPSS